MPCLCWFNELGRLSSLCQVLVSSVEAPALTDEEVTLIADVLRVLFNLVRNLLNNVVRSSRVV